MKDFQVFNMILCDVSIDELQIKRKDNEGKQRSKSYWGIYMNYSMRPIGTAATSPQIFETKQDPSPAHEHTHTHR